MSRIKELLEGHPLFVLISILLLGIGIGAIPIPIREAAHDQEINRLAAESASAKTELDRTIAGMGAEIADLERDIASIRRVSGDVEEPFPVEAMIVAARDASNLSPQTYDEFADMDVFVSVDAPRDWEHELSSEHAQIAKALGVSVAELRTFYALPDAPMHVWELRDSHHLVEDPNTDEELVLSTAVSIQRMSADDLIVLLGSTPGVSEDPEVFAALETMVSSDPSGAMLQLQFGTMLATTTSQSIAVINAIDSTDNTIYLQVTNVMTGVVVDGDPVEQLFLYREMIILDLGEDLALVSTRIPSTQRSSNDFSDVQRLLTSIRLLEG